MAGSYPVVRILSLVCGQEKSEDADQLLLSLENSGAVTCVLAIQSGPHLRTIANSRLLQLLIGENTLGCVREDSRSPHEASHQYNPNFPDL